MNDLSHLLKGNLEKISGLPPEQQKEILALIEEYESVKEKETARKNLKASAKAKLVAGEALTEEEANTIVI